eukprot:scaffold316864_cov18-Prasinocladus_malaysianus.AAC.1
MASSLEKSSDEKKHTGCLDPPRYRVPCDTCISYETTCPIKSYGQNTYEAIAMHEWQIARTGRGSEPMTWPMCEPMTRH